MSILRRGEARTDSSDDVVSEQINAPQPTIKERIEALPLILNPRSVLYDSGSIAPSSQGPRYTDHVTDPAALQQLGAEVWDEMLSGNRETLGQMSQTKPW